MLTMKDDREAAPRFAQRCRRECPYRQAKKITTLKEMIEFVINRQDPEMAEKYSLRPGIGLAAPQIGVSKKMIAVHVTDADGT